MAETIREQIIRDLIARAAVIRTAASYRTECGAKVFRARTKVDPADLPCINIVPQPETSENIHGRAKHQMPVRLEGLATYGTLEPSVVSEQILGDLFSCFTAPEWVFAGTRLFDSIVYQGGGTDSYPGDGETTVGASANYVITYYTAIGDPCSQ